MGEDPGRLVTRLGGNAFVYGAIGATYSIFQFFAAPALGRWSDSVGRRRVLMWCQLGTVGSWLIFLVAMNLPVKTVLSFDTAWLGAVSITLPILVIFLSRALDGATGGDASVASAYMADLSPPGDFQKNFGRMAVASSLGLIIGPSLGGLLSSGRFGETPAVLAAMAMSGIAVFLIARFLPNSTPVALEQHPGADHPHKAFGHAQAETQALPEAAQAGWSRLFRLPRVGFVLSLQFIVLMAYNLFFTAFPVYVTKQLGWGSHEVGYFFSFLGFATIVVQGPVLGFLAPRLGNARMMVLGGIFLGGGFLLFDEAHTATQYAGGALFALGNGLLTPSLTAMLARSAGDYQGAVQGMAGSISSLASIIGLLAGGILFSALGKEMFVVSAVMAFAVGALSLRFAFANTGGAKPEPGVE